MPDNHAITVKLATARAYVGNLEIAWCDGGITDNGVLNTFMLLIEAIEILQAEVRARDEEIGRLTQLHQDHDGRSWRGVHH